MSSAPCEPWVWRPQACKPRACRPHGLLNSCTLGQVACAVTPVHGRGRGRGIESDASLGHIVWPCSLKPASLSSFPFLFGSGCFFFLPRAVSQPLPWFALSRSVWPSPSNMQIHGKCWNQRETNTSKITFRMSQWPSERPASVGLMSLWSVPEGNRVAVLVLAPTLSGPHSWQPASENY